LGTSSGSWFRLSDVCVAPDGSVMLADWYDPGVGGHGMGDWTRGRIYRVTPKGHKGYKVPAVDLKSGEGLIHALLSPCLASGALAIDHIRKSPPDSFLAALSPRLMKLKGREKGFEGDDVGLARALWMLLETAGTKEKYPHDSALALGELSMLFDGVRLDDKAQFIRIGEACSRKFGGWPVIQLKDGDAKTANVLASLPKFFQDKERPWRPTISDLR